MNQKRTHILPAGSMNFETAKADSAPEVSNPVTPNFLSFIEAQENITSGSASILYTKLMNALTGRIVTHLQWHCIMRDAGKLADKDRDYFRNLSEGKTLDERNAQDEAERGTELKDYLTHASGFDVRMSHLQAAEILNGLRLWAYDRMAAFTDLPDPKIILFRRPPGVDVKELRRYPMGIELALQGLVERSGKPTEAALQAARNEAVAFKRTAEAGEQAARQEAQRQQRQLMSIYQDILAEADSLESGQYDEDDWMALDLAEREIVIDKVNNNLGVAIEKAFNQVITARPGSDWKTLQEEQMKDAEHAKSIVAAFMTAHPFTTRGDSTVAMAATLTKLGGAYKPSKIESTESGIADMADDIPS
jgi:hypothetical protein